MSKEPRPSVDTMIVRHTATHALYLPLLCVTLLAAICTLPNRAHARPKITDSNITSAVETNLLIDDEVPFHNIDVITRDGIVTLKGSVYTILARNKATQIAESIKGVRSVVNEITVRAVLRSDKEIRQDVVDALLTDSATDPYKITVAVNEGNVTLSGKVDSYGEKNLCGEVAKRVRGVKKITNDIIVNYKTKRADKTIEEEVEARFRDDVAINAERILVKVQDGKVKLSGTVRSAAEKSQARTKAWVAGVYSVDDGDLKVEWFAPDSVQRDSAYVTTTDKQTEKAVHDALQQDPRVWSFDVAVDSDHGVVTLTGAVGNLKARQAAEEDARNTVGARRIKNHLKVRPIRHVSDAKIIENVNSALKRNACLDRYDIVVSAYNGKVYLYGTVDSEFEKIEAEDVAFRVEGVTEVADYLKVREAPLWQNDWEIADRVKYQLYWDSDVDAANVDVAVQDGIVTLTGSVDTWYEYKAAAEDACRGGAREIRNHLDVKHAPPL